MRVFLRALKEASVGGGGGGVLKVGGRVAIEFGGAGGIAGVDITEPVPDDGGVLDAGGDTILTMLNFMSQLWAKMERWVVARAVFEEDCRL